MKLRNIIPWLYAVSVATLCLALYAKANESEIFVSMFILALISQILFAAFAVYELRGSEQITKGEKSDYTVLIFCAPLIFGTWYLLKLRKRILYI